MKPCVLIPSHNEAQNIAAVVRECKKQDLDVVVVDDGSADNTAGLAREAGALVIARKTNRGKGYSLKEGIAFILREDYGPILIMDGDGQHDPQDIPAFLARARDNAIDMLLGNRMRDVKDMPLLRRATNIFMSFIISKLARQKIPDTQCGFRLIKRHALENFKLSSEHFEIESEMILEAAKSNYRIENIPIATIYRNETSGIHPFRDTIRFIKLLLRYI